MTAIPNLALKEACLRIKGSSNDCLAEYTEGLTFAMKGIDNTEKKLNSSNTLLENNENLRSQLSPHFYNKPFSKPCLAQREIKSLKAERDGLEDVINALTSDNKAIALAKASNTKNTLSVEATRILEIMPWDKRAEELASVEEEVYEWGNPMLSSQLTDDSNFVSHVFRDLPFGKPVSHQNKVRIRAKLKELTSRNELPKGYDEDKLKFSSRSFITDKEISYKLETSYGRITYPLPKEGFWEWIGGWKIKHAIEYKGNEYGWFSPTFLVNDGHYNLQHRFGDSVQKLRCRKWTRKRVLKFYPSMSEQTRSHLSLLAQNASLSLIVEKLSDQLLEIHSKLAEVDKLEIEFLQNTNKNLELQSKEKQNRIHQLEETLKKNRIKKKDARLLLDKAFCSIFSRRDRNDVKSMEQTFCSVTMKNEEDDSLLNTSLDTNEFYSEKFDLDVSTVGDSSINSLINIDSEAGSIHHGAFFGNDSFISKIRRNSVSQDSMAIRLSRRFAKRILPDRVNSFSSILQKRSSFTQEMTQETEIDFFEEEDFVLGSENTYNCLDVDLDHEDDTIQNKILVDANENLDNATTSSWGNVSSEERNVGGPLYDYWPK